MLKRLRFQNWRSLQNVEIKDLTPITVFIGANSTGKTNIIDALRFLQYAHSRSPYQDIVGAVRYKWGGVQKVRTAGILATEAVIIEFDLQTNIQNTLLTWTAEMTFPEDEKPFVEYKTRLHHPEWQDDLKRSANHPIMERPASYDDWSETDEARANANEQKAVESYVDAYIRRRWQVFRELFMPQIVMPVGETDPGDLYVVEEDGSNIVFILDHMMRQQPDLYAVLLEDLNWLLHHVEGVRTTQTERELRLIVQEKWQSIREAQSISAGTARLIAMLTAYYALDVDSTASSDDKRTEWSVPLNSMPGLVIIEEPDTALNPGLLENFVDQLRVYTDLDKDRQFILTTHNPSFLNYFKPEEVRVLDRNDQGHTIVSSIPAYISDIWLEKYGLGEVWMTNSFGGLQV